MKLRYQVLTFALVLGFLGINTSSSFAQVGDVGSILQAGQEDANALARAYLEPFGSGFGASLNTGWTNTASPHKKFGFDVTLSAGLTVVPSEIKAFDVTNLKLDVLEPERSDPNRSTITPTINGEAETGTLLAAYENINGSEEKILEFNMPEGSGFGYVPAPMIKAGVGLIKDTEIMFRYMPEYEVGDFGSFNLFGVGAKHGLNQWLPGGKALPVNLSVMFGYTNMEVSAPLDLTAQDVIEDQSRTENTYSPSEWDGQEISLNTDAWTINALVGKKLPILSVYAGVGYEASSFNIKTAGSYPTVKVKDNPTPNEPLTVEAVDEPINVSIDGDNGFRALAGFRVRVAVFHLSASYTLANYSSYNVGFGISFR